MQLQIPPLNRDNKLKSSQCKNQQLQTNRELMFHEIKLPFMTCVVGVGCVARLIIHVYGWEWVLCYWYGLPRPRCSQDRILQVSGNQISTSHNQPPLNRRMGFNSFTQHIHHCVSIYVYSGVFFFSPSQIKDNENNQFP